MDVEAVVESRYSEAAKAREAALCCPTTYDSAVLKVIPEEVLKKDYGCGDPTQYLAAGETVLDLGSGAGKLCFIASQVVGKEGRVIGVDINDDMLEVARRNAPVVAKGIGYSNVEFRKGVIQDLSTDVERLDAWLKENPVASARDLSSFEEKVKSFSLIEDESMDVVISNCVLNLVRSEEKAQLFQEIYRVLRRGGRAVISDIVSDESIPKAMEEDPELWSGCISGAYREDLFLKAFEEVGFYGCTLSERQAAPWQTVEGIEFRSYTVVAYKGKEGLCLDQKHAVIYKGPFKEVLDDDGHAFGRGVRTAVCEKTFKIFSREPYVKHVELIEPYEVIPLEEAPVFSRTGNPARDPRETKGENAPKNTQTNAKNDSASPGSTGCC